MKNSGNLRLFQKEEVTESLPVTGAYRLLWFDVNFGVKIEYLFRRGIQPKFTRFLFASRAWSVLIKMA
jgi:hypothetical protein